MNPELKIVKTADGSNTIFNPAVGENYHSIHGALQESKHVFVNAGLNYFLNRIPEVSPTGGDLDGAAVSILEVGFGTGLNFLLSADFCTAKEIKLNYTGVEAYPLSPEMISQTGYDEYLSATIWANFISEYAGSLTNTISVNPYCKLQIAHCRLQEFQSSQQYDIIYFDAFAVGHQPEMWEEAAISHTVKFLKPGGVFVTYAITGNLKRALKALGCKVEKVPGAAGKREMLRAVKLNS
ncbi:MAG: mnmC [Mucilaginibacter sp.]|nr:mnmC [Mucilaginibacter sp.]